MDTRLLTLGKFDIQKPSQNRCSKAIRSECYFDWIQLKNYKDIKESTNEKRRITSSQKIFRHDILLKDNLVLDDDDIDVTDSLRGHLQESMLLVSEEESETFLLSPECVYFSMINIPMWDEEVFPDTKRYADIRKEIFDFITGLLEPERCRLYHTFDHCDFVLVADGTKITFKDYMGILKIIRNHYIEVKVIQEDEREEKVSKIFSVLDITSIYGYTEEYLNCNRSYDEKFNMILELSFKRLAYENSLLSRFSVSPSHQIKTVGRYDTVLCWENITLYEFNSIISLLRNDDDKFFTYKVIIGFDDYDETINNQVSDIKNDEMSIFSLSRSRMFSHSKDIFVSLYNSLKSRGLRKVLLNALFEIQNSVRAMLKNGFAQYYILSFYESFYSFMAFINRLLCKANSFEKGSINQKKLLEKIDDSFREYFSFLNALNACTIHSERQFLQTDSYQLLYYDALPKLIAFYTAIANRIASVIEQNTQNHYTFLITPDFKSDIFVDSITEDRTVDNELNILIIHIDEESLYNVTSTIKAIIHEIFHHIGQSSDLREKRAVYYQKCCLAYILANNIPYSLIAHQDDEEYDYRLFKQLVDSFFTKFISLKEPSEKYFADKKISREQSVHYLEYLTEEFLYQVEGWFDTDDFTFVEDILHQVFTTPFPDVVNCFNGSFSIEKVSGKEYDVLTRYSNRIIAKTISKKIINWLAVHTDKDEYSTIQHAFRESFADTQMLHLVKGNVDGYIDMIHEFDGEKNPDEMPRIGAVLKHYNAHSHPWLEIYKNSTLRNKPDSLNKLELWEEMDPIKEGNLGFFYWYLSEVANEYLSQLNTMFTQPEITVLSENISGLIDCLESKSINEIVQIIDTEIFEYRKRLLDMDSIDH